MNSDKHRPRDPFLQFKDEVYAQYAQRYPDIKGAQLVALLAQDFRKLPNDVIEKYEKRYQQQLEETEAQKNQMGSRKINFKTSKNIDGTNNQDYSVNINCEHILTEIHLILKKRGQKEEIPVKIKIGYEDE